MAKLESTFRNMVLVLSTITLVAAVALGSVYNLTKEPIEASKRAKKENAIREVLPQFERIDEAVEVKLEGMAKPFFVYRAYQGDQLVGAAVQTYTMNGFSGEIKVMVGFNVQGEIVNYSILEQKETPGLGTKMDIWFKTEKGKQDIRGMHPALNNLEVTKKGGEVDAITAATISSVAFLESVRSAYNAWLEIPQETTPANEVASTTEQQNQEGTYE